LKTWGQRDNLEFKDTRAPGERKGSSGKSRTKRGRIRNGGAPRALSEEEVDKTARILEKRKKAEKKDFPRDQPQCKRKDREKTQTVDSKDGASRTMGAGSGL